jgi:hypothetical protein
MTEAAGCVAAVDTASIASLLPQDIGIVAYTAGTAARHVAYCA